MLKANQVPLLPDKFYHVYNRGNNGEDLFVEKRNYYHFLDLWRKHISPVAETYAYCLLLNHFHFLIKIRDAENIVSLISKKYGIKGQAPETSQVSKTCEVFINKRFSNCFNAYTKAINKSYGRNGSLFQERFKRKEVTEENYFSRLILYIHTNPQKHGLTDNFKDWSHSSYKSHLSEKPTQLMRNEVLEWFGSRKEYEEFHKWDDEFLNQDWDEYEG